MFALLLCEYRLQVLIETIMLGKVERQQEKRKTPCEMDGLPKRTTGLSLEAVSRALEDRTFLRLLVHRVHPKLKVTWKQVARTTTDSLSPTPPRRRKLGEWAQNLQEES